MTQASPMKTSEAAAPLGYSVGARVTQGDAPLQRLAQKLGSIEALAAELDVGRRSIERWISGDTAPSGAAKKAVEALAKSRGITGNLWPPKKKKNS